MLRFQIALVILLAGCIAFLSCGRTQEMLDDPVTDDTTMEAPVDQIWASWASVTLPAPTMTVEEAAAAMNPGGTGAIHGMGPRTIYFNEIGAMANAAGGPYPVGTMIVKEVMDATDPSVITAVVTMTKTDDPMYDAYNGWIYGTPEPLEMAQGCHDCHAKATVTLTTDNVFVSLRPADTMDDTTQRFEITLTNLTMGVHGKSGQTLSPAIFVTHDASFILGEVGQPASEALVAQAEGGKTAGIEALAEAAGAHYMISMNEDMTRRYTMPGQSSTVTVTANMMNSLLSVSSMLVSTNDAFIAAMGVPLFDEAGMPVSTTIDLMAYDAGSEENTEMHTDIPGPLGLGDAIDPSGSNARVPTEGDVIAAHPGIQGGADVDKEKFGWTEPVATLKIMPVTTMSNGAADDAGNGNGADNGAGNGNDAGNGGAAQ